MKILVVDDSMAMRMIVLRTLRMAGYAGHSYLEAGNGKEAIKTIQKEQPDLVLMDWNMPEMDGITCLRTLRSFGFKVPVGFVTSEGTPEIRATASEAGASFLITKPFTVDSFRKVLDPILS